MGVTGAHTALREEAVQHFSHGTVIEGDDATAQCQRFQYSAVMAGGSQCQREGDMAGGQDVSQVVAQTEPGDGGFYSLLLELAF